MIWPASAHIIDIKKPVLELTSLSDVAQLKNTLFLIQCVQSYEIQSNYLSSSRVG